MKHQLHNLVVGCVKKRKFCFLNWFWICFHSSLPDVPLFLCYKDKPEHMCHALCCSLFLIFSLNQVFSPISYGSLTLNLKPFLVHSWAVYFCCIWFWNEVRSKNRHPRKGVPSIYWMLLISLFADCSKNGFIFRILLQWVCGDRMWVWNILKLITDMFHFYINHLCFDWHLLLISPETLIYFFPGVCWMQRWNGRN